MRKVARGEEAPFRAVSLITCMVATVGDCTCYLGDAPAAGAVQTHHRSLRWPAPY